MFLYLRCNDKMLASQTAWPLREHLGFINHLTNSFRKPYPVSHIQRAYWAWFGASFEFQSPCRLTLYLTADPNERSGTCHQDWPHNGRRIRLDGGRPLLDVQRVNDLKPEVQLLIFTSTGILLETDKSWTGHPDPWGLTPRRKKTKYHAGSSCAKCTFHKQRDIMDILYAVDAGLPKGWEW